MAVEGELEGAEEGSTLRHQLDLCRRTLQEILAHLDGTGPPVAPAMAQMVVDQWDPMWSLTELVVEAEQLYEDGRRQEDRDG